MRASQLPGVSRLPGLILLAIPGLLFALPNASEAASAQTLGCATNGAVTDSADNTGLVAVCEALLGMKNALGASGLNWSASLLKTDSTEPPRARVREEEVARRRDETGGVGKRTGEPPASSLPAAA